jgi:acid phosphatase
MHRSSRKLFLLGVLAIGFLISSCSSSSSLQHPTTSATLWTQNSAEYNALTTMVYQSAESNLPMAVEDSYWTAYPQQEEQKLRKLPPAVILDVDETVLDNSPFQARMIEQNSSYDPQQWNDWVMEAKASPVPGAVEFTQEAVKRGVAVFYLTNREGKVEDGTRKNLKKHGFPLSEDEDRILSKNELQNWTSAKTDRRAYIAQNHRILMVLGDDLNDFISAKDISQKERAQLVEEHKDKWGKLWYILPNPVYGSWENALYNFDSSLSPAQIDSAKKTRLNPKKD